MSQAAQILELARERALDENLPYSGAVTPAEAWALYQALPNVRIVDVRTRAEWQFVGIVPDAELIEWKSYPLMNLNPDFLSQLKSKVDPECIVLFLCRSAYRSHEAAMLAAQHGYSEAYNVLEGFEGEKDAHQQRGRLNGWKSAGLPWVNP
ncbi:thiosulfate sulfurtransferase [Formivibrio citricus]|uniref:Thiosulfate sulfurtransferase n=1 Tax=Formivibrio citricus TaxID=83765 RepID=A0A1I4XT31_9NEIS|nr:rhodanese-like domain-containing protein [Formivibrio citricus]SFN28917.1 thiosulfate sulfurtransferase [Formivibrio citricus]